MKKFIVLQAGTNKNGQPYSIAKEIIKYSKEGRENSFISDNSFQKLDEILPIGKVIEVEVQIKR